MTYRLKRKEYEEQMEELYQQRDKAISIIEEVQERSYYYLKDYAPHIGNYKQGYQQTEHLKEDVQESTKVELKKLSRKMEDLEENYYRKLREVNEN